jgi:hypothetical protein
MMASRTQIRQRPRKSRRVIADRSFQGPPGDISHMEGSDAAELIQPEARRLNSLDRDEAAEGDGPQVNVICRTKGQDALGRPQPAESSRCQQRSIPVRVTQSPDQAGHPGKADGRLDRFPADVAWSTRIIVDGVATEAPEHRTIPSHDSVAGSRSTVAGRVSGMNGGRQEGDLPAPDGPAATRSCTRYTQLVRSLACRSGGQACWRRFPVAGCTWRRVPRGPERRISGGRSRCPRPGRR